MVEDLALDFTIPGYDIELRVSAVGVPIGLLICLPFLCSLAVETSRSPQRT